MGDSGRLRGAVIFGAWFALTAAVYVSRSAFSVAAVAVMVLVAVVLVAVDWTAPTAPRGALVAAVAAGGPLLVLGGSYRSLLPGWGEAVIVLVTGLAGVSCAALMAMRRRRTDMAAVAVAGATVAVTGGVVILRTRPTLDVWVFMQQAADIVGRANIYGQAWDGVRLDASGARAVTEGFPYPPAAAFLAAPARWLLGDVRWAMLAAILLAGVLIARRGWGTDRALLAAAFWLTPGTLMMLETAWTESLVLVLLLPALWCFRSGRTLWAVALLAVALATKQHLWVLLPVFAVWRPAGAARTAAAAGGAALICLPWFLADPGAFLHDTVTLHLEMPVRLDASTLYVWAVTAGHEPPAWLPVIVLLAVVVVVCRKVWATQPADLGLPLAAVLLVANLVNKQAFLNQYWLVAGLILWGLASPGRPRRHVRLPPASEDAAPTVPDRTAAGPSASRSRP